MNSQRTKPYSNTEERMASYAYRKADKWWLNNGICKICSISLKKQTKKWNQK